MAGKGLYDHGATRYVDPVPDSRAATDFMLMYARKFAP
jgi:hypothetical protein